MRKKKGSEPRTYRRPRLISVRKRHGGDRHKAEREPSDRGFLKSSENTSYQTDGTRSQVATGTLMASA